MIETKKEIINFEGNPIQVTPAQVDADVVLKSLEDEVSKEEEHLQNLIVTKETKKAVKESKAKANKLRKNISRFRIDANNYVLKPLGEFNERSKSLEKRLDSLTNGLKVKLNDLEETEKKERHEYHLKQIDQIGEEYDLTHEVITYNPKWDNKTFSESEFKEAVRTQFDIVYKERQQRQEDIKALKVAVDGYSKPAMTEGAYLTMLSKGMPLSAVLSQLDKDHRELQEIAKKQAETRKKEQEQEVIKDNKVINKDTGEVVDEVRSGVLRITATKSQLRGLVTYMRSHGIKYEEVK